MLENIIDCFKSFFFCTFYGPEHVRVSDDGSQGRLQFMGERRSKILLPARLFLQLLHFFRDSISHLIKIMGQSGDLITALLPGTRTVIASCKVPGCTGKLMNGMRQDMGHQIYQNCCNYRQYQDYDSVPVIIRFSVKINIRYIFHIFQIINIVIEHGTACIDKPRSFIFPY